MQGSLFVSKKPSASSYPCMEVGEQSTWNFKAAVNLALRWLAGLLEEQGLEEARSGCFAQLSLPTADTWEHFLFPPVQYLWVVGALHQGGKGRHYPLDCELENAHIKHLLTQGKSYATTFTLLHLSCIHAGKIYTQSTAALDTPHISFFLFPSHPVSFHPSPCRGSAPG